jgi:TRAP-type mannitol/chloroaromatic compound transport system permease small subunit
MIALRRLIEAVTAAMSAIAGWGFVFCAFFIGLEVVARNFLGVSTQSTTEISGYMLAFGIAWALAHTLVVRGHVRIDVLLMRLPLRLRAVLHIASLVLLGVFVAFVLYGAVSLTQESWDFGATDISLLRTPLIIPQGLWTLGILALFAVILLMLAESIALLAAGDWGRLDALYRPRGYDEEAQEALDALASIKTKR